MKRWASLVLAAGVIIASIGAIWARQESQQPEPVAPGEYRRCVKTCNALMEQFNRSYPRMRVHEGDRRCWETCWARMGKGEPDTASSMKKLWLEQMPSNMRANQCARACWRRQHEQDETVRIGGWRSEPRSALCK